MISRDPHTNPSQANNDINLSGVQYERNPDAEYGYHIKNTTAMCNTSASHTYGNVMAVVEKYILSEIFPPDTFKTVTASTTLASRQIIHTPRQLHKRELPMMVLVPRIAFGQDENRFLGHTLFNDRYTNTYSYWGDGSLIPLAEDKQKRIWIHGHYNRAVMYIDIVLNFDTYSEQTNWMSHLYNNASIGHNKFIRAPLELYIPNDFCKLIENISNVKMKSDNSVYEFLSYMNKIWYHPITYKLKGGSNTDEFFMYYLADIDMVIQDIQPPGTGTKEGQIRRGFDIAFTVRCDFNTIGYFTLNSPNIKKQVHIMSKEDLSIIPMFSDVINLDDFNLPMGWTILGWPIFKLDTNQNSISIDPILNQSLKSVIDYHLKFGIPMEKFINIQFRENGQVLNDELFYIDWAKRLLVLIRPNIRRTYRLIISVSYEYINNLVKYIYKLE